MFVTNDASVVATAFSTGMVGIAVLDGMEHDVKINNTGINKSFLIRRLYSFSEQMNFMDVLQ